MAHTSVTCLLSVVGLAGELLLLLLALVLMISGTTCELLVADEGLVVVVVLDNGLVCVLWLGLLFEVGDCITKL